MNPRKFIVPLAAELAMAVSLSAVAATHPANPFGMEAVHDGRAVNTSELKVSEGSCMSGAMKKAHGGKCGTRYMKEHHIHKNMSRSS